MKFLQDHLSCLSIQPSLHLKLYQRSGQLQHLSQQYPTFSTDFIPKTELVLIPSLIQEVLLQGRKVKETEKSRVKRETTVGKTPASTVPLKTVPVHHVVPQTYSNVITPQIVPNFFTVNPNIIPNVYTASKTPVTTFPYNVPNVYTDSKTPVTTFPYNVPNVYTDSKTPVPTFPYNVFPTFYTVPTVVPTTDTKTTTNVKSDSVPVQPVVYSGVTNPFYTYDPNFITRQVEAQKT
ncbi:Peroxisome biogenesis factor 10, partial [Armadillidium vulgare]